MIQFARTGGKTGTGYYSNRFTLEILVVRLTQLLLEDVPTSMAMGCGESWVPTIQRP